MKNFESFSDLRCNLHLIPEVIAFDVILRINDWVISGGTIDDEYVKRQVRYASNFIKEC